ncbi:MAG TPA: multicopper oxidase domain-containing protein, partial [Lacunisphaera sp.]|nr:multicopper oxidase domain-containing protein [Lacunisphaera sp.]
MKSLRPLLLLASALAGYAMPAFAEVVEYDLTVEHLVMSPAGKPVPVLALNGGLPGPTLRFKEGDLARVRVHNRLKDETTSVHWHGLLLPNEQDGVPGLTTPPIQPGTTHTFEFPLKHSGTYWYHSHTMLQEQIGIYGSIVVEPRDGEPQRADREHVLVFSDWTNEPPHEVMRTLKRGSEYYSYKKGLLPNLVGAAKAGALRDYFHREWTRMPPMDISDVAYDAFLVNGKPRVELPGNPGEVIRLRMINASAASYFYIQSGGGPMKVVAADGPAVEPFEIDRLFIAIAETYDALVTVPDSGALEIRATAQDGSGYASAIIGDGPARTAPTMPRPDVYTGMDDMLMAALDEMEQAENDETPPSAEHGGGHDSSPGAHPSGHKAVSGHEVTAAAEMNERPLSPYRQLRSPVVTTLPDLPTRTITLRLTGDMERYVWHFNGKTLHEDPVIPVRRGENIRMVLINDSMMHHPIHLHGHFFRVINGQGERSPLKHTVDVPPMGRRVVEFEANEYKDWMLHCHVLYHMMSGMTRIVSYDDQGHHHHPDLSGEHHGLYWWAE